MERTTRTLLAWGVHLYTALGLVAAAGIAALVIREPANPEAFRWAFVLMLAATLIDATDGTLARRIRVKEILPGFDGAKLDDLIDFITYTALPLLLVWRAGILPAGQAWWLLVPLLASAYGFSQVAAKTADGFFLGFPSYWNLVAFYLYILRPSAWLAIAVLVALALLTFVPIRYLYPSQRGQLNRWTTVLGMVWGVFLAWIILQPGDWQPDDPHIRRLTVISLVYPGYYLAASWLVHWRLRRRRPREARGARDESRGNGDAERGTIGQNASLATTHYPLPTTVAPRP
jgi:phosphatidylcholine synthase